MAPKRCYESISVESGSVGRVPCDATIAMATGSAHRQRHHHAEVSPFVTGRGRLFMSPDPRLEQGITLQEMLLGSRVSERLRCLEIRSYLTYNYNFLHF
jgi:hypothetical protein